MSVWIEMVAVRMAVRTHLVHSSVSVLVSAVDSKQMEQAVSVCIALLFLTLSACTRVMVVVLSVCVSITMLTATHLVYMLKTR